MIDEAVAPEKPQIDPAVYERLRQALASAGPRGAVEQLIADLRQAEDFQNLFYALLMKKLIPIVLASATVALAGPTAALGSDTVPTATTAATLQTKFGKQRSAHRHGGKVRAAWPRSKKARAPPDLVGLACGGALEPHDDRIPGRVSVARRDLSSFSLGSIYCRFDRGDSCSSRNTAVGSPREVASRGCRNR